MVSNPDIYDVVIIGGGPGGMAAGLYAMRAAMKSILIEKGIAGGQMTTTTVVENYPGIEEITGMDLSEKFMRHAQSYGLEVLRQEVVAVEPGTAYHSVRLENGNTLNAYAVILAVGGSARKLNIPGELEFAGKGVSYCGTCDGFFFRNQIITVNGGGDTALEEALYLSKVGSRVYLVHRRDEFRASRILQERVFADPKIELILSTVITEIKGNRQGVNAVTLQNVRTKEKRDLKTDGVFIFVGFLPSNQLVPAGVKMSSDGYVTTDEKCETSIPGIFAAGDLRLKYANQIVIAAADGCTAALAAARYVEQKKSGVAA
ncbi:MAG: thioredoxin-disulfide reductase [Syntrophobacteraceae bacterium]